MEFTQEIIDSLSVNEVELMTKIADELNIRVAQVSAVISLVACGSSRGAGMVADRLCTGHDRPAYSPSGTSVAVHSQSHPLGV